MSHPQEPNKAFFPFGNPFKMISPKGSQLSPKLLAMLDAFEETLAGRMRKLVPNGKDDVLSLSWMKVAMESLSATHNDIKVLITELELPVGDWEEKWIDVYLDISVKLLDICIAFSSELSRLNQGHLLLQCLLHNLGSNSSEQLIRARSSMDGWRHLISSKNSRVENCFAILGNLMESLNQPKVKNSAKGKVLMRAMYGVKVMTVFICSVFSSAFLASSHKLLELNVPATFLWAQSFNILQATLHGEMRNNGQVRIVKELEAVDTSIKTLYPMIQEGVAPVEVEAFQISIVNLGNKADKLSRDLDHLTKEVDQFFQIVLTGRDALLCNLRAGGSFTDLRHGSNLQKKQAVR